MLAVAEGERGRRDLLSTMPLRFAVVCRCNMNRSMEVFAPINRAVAQVASLSAALSTLISTSAHFGRSVRASVLLITAALELPMRSTVLYHSLTGGELTLLTVVNRLIKYC